MQIVFCFLTMSNKWKFVLLLLVCEWRVTSAPVQRKCLEASKPYYCEASNTCYGYEEYCSESYGRPVSCYLDLKGHATIDDFCFANNGNISATLDEPQCAMACIARQLKENRSQVIDPNDGNESSTAATPAMAVSTDENVSGIILSESVVAIISVSIIIGLIALPILAIVVYCRCLPECWKGKINKLLGPVSDPPDNQAGPEREDLLQIGARLREENERLREENERLPEENENLRVENERLREENERLREENERLREDNERLREENERLRVENERLREENERLREENERLREENEKLAKDSEDLVEKKKTLVEKTAYIKGKKDQLTDDTKHLVKKKAQLTSSTETLMEKEERLTKHVQELDEKKERLTKHIQELDEKKERLTKHIQELDEKKERLTKDTEELDGKRERLTKDTEELDGKKEQLTKDTEELDEKEERPTKDTEELNEKKENLGQSTSKHYRQHKCQANKIIMEPKSLRKSPITEPGKLQKQRDQNNLVGRQEKVERTGDTIEEDRANSPSDGGLSLQVVPEREGKQRQRCVSERLEEVREVLRPKRSRSEEQINEVLSHNALKELHHQQKNSAVE